MLPDFPPAATQTYFDVIAGFFLNVLSSLAGWFIQLLTKGDLIQPFLAAFFIYLTFKFLIFPLLGSAGSDEVKKKKE